MTWGDVYSDIYGRPASVQRGIDVRWHVLGVTRNGREKWTTILRNYMPGEDIGANESSVVNDVLMGRVHWADEESDPIVAVRELGVVGITPG